MLSTELRLRLKCSHLDEKVHLLLGQLWALTYTATAVHTDRQMAHLIALHVKELYHMLQHNAARESFTLVQPTNNTVLVPQWHLGPRAWPHNIMTPGTEMNS
jgi:hypothetical protein